ncbi:MULTISPECIES: DNA polymerase I [Ruminococcus]|uniref:DNA polymerase I n=1 Tax=Ruminococcus bovis TaxID=2564099 RepID=A0A4V1G4V3_9FIRM|nr:MULTISPECIES: DNA polymerase I [Ruminococcus]MEE3439441.1 DNA polymerase I [Ruminococcus sp.]QCT06023.1 DNA polymerase I [Ruminococcus bovis]
MKLLVVDGNSILNRAFYGIRLLTTKDGQFTNAIYGFLTMLLKIQEDVTPDAVAIAFDLKAPTFRHKAYEGYKSNRKGMPEELHQQLQPLKDLLTLLGYTIITKEGYEADDILGTLSHTCKVKGDECVLATGDRDSLQLINDKVTVRLASTKGGKANAILYDEKKIMEDYGVTPRQLIEIKAIQGDSSDCIPGIPGIGPKGAGDLIQRFDNLDYIYENLDTIDIKDGMRKKLRENKDSAYMSRMLGEIKLDIPIDTDINHYLVNCTQPDEASRMMAKLELFSLIDKFKLKEVESAEETPKEKKKYSLNEKNTIDLSGKELYIYSNSKSKGDIDYLYIIEENEIIKTTDVDTVLKSENKKYVYSSKELFAYADKNDFEIKNLVFDVTLASYLLNPNSSSYDIDKLNGEYEVEIYDGEDEFLCNIAPMVDLCNILEKKIEQCNQKKLLNEIEIPLSNVLARMENLGFAVDKQGIEDFGKMLKENIENLKSEIYNSVGREFNINSPKQLGVALFEDLALPCKKKTKSGYSTSADVLESLKNQHPVVSMVLQYRTLSKLNSTYCEGLLKVIGDDGRIHSSFNQTETRTGRISSTEPNLQNIPVRTELGREMRKFFTARDGWVLVDADYSQIELRVLADISGDKNMIDAFKNNQDIHAITASQVFNMPLDFVTGEMRSRAKAVNFGIVYGIGAYSLAKDIGVTNKEAKNYIESYLKHYSGIDKYMHDVVEKAKDTGYVETVFGRRRYLPELSASNGMTRAFGERVARNAPIQGTAADIIKIAMIKVDKRLTEENLEARLVLQVHDELIVECPSHESMRVAMILQEEMEKAVSLSVPLVADSAVGKTWYDAKG